MNKITICLVVVQVFLLNAHFGSAASGYKNEGLKLQNKYRSKHGSPPLKLDSSLNKIAETCAAYYAKGGNYHGCPERKGYGENIGESWASKGTPSYSKETARGIKSWYDESKDYNFKNPKKGGPTTGHFTQLVWKESQKVGLGCASNQGKKKTYCVSIYSPAGNMNGPKNYKANVKSG